MSKKSKDRFRDPMLQVTTRDSRNQSFDLFFTNLYIKSHNNGITEIPPFTQFWHDCMKERIRPFDLATLKDICHSCHGTGRRRRRAREKGEDPTSELTKVEQHTASLHAKRACPFVSSFLPSSFFGPFLSNFTAKTTKSREGGGSFFKFDL